ENGNGTTTISPAAGMPTPRPPRVGSNPRPTLLRSRWQSHGLTLPRLTDEVLLPQPSPMRGAVLATLSLPRVALALVRQLRLRWSVALRHRCSAILKYHGALDHSHPVY